MTRDQLLADLRRALEACEPERAEELLRDVERRVPPEETLRTPGAERVSLDELYRSVRAALRASFPDRADAILEEFDRRQALAQVIRANLPRQGGSYERTEGKGSSNVPLAGDVCPRCEKAGGVRYLGTVVNEGSLEYYHLVHTEVDDWFACTGCNAAWSEMRYL